MQVLFSVIHFLLGHYLPYFLRKRLLTCDVKVKVKSQTDLPFRHIHQASAKLRSCLCIITTKWLFEQKCEWKAKLLIHLFSREPRLNKRVRPSVGWYVMHLLGGRTRDGERLISCIRTCYLWSLPTRFIFFVNLRATEIAVAPSLVGAIREDMSRRKIQLKTIFSWKISI